MHPTDRLPRDAGPTAGDVATLARAEIWLVAALSAGAAAIHLAAGPAHVEALGDAGTAFYWVALVQAVLSVLLLRNGITPRLAMAGIATSLVFIGAWAMSRSVGLPLFGEPEGIGVADGACQLLQVALVVVLVVHRSRPERPRWPARPVVVSRRG